MKRSITSKAAKIEFDALQCLQHGCVPDAVDLKFKNLVRARQVHGTNVLHVDSPCDHLECDALITNTPHLTLVILHADCQAAILYDRVNHALALVHAGWRGQVGRIYTKTVAAMRNAFGTQPQDLTVCISPSLGPKSAEFVNYRQEFPKELWEYKAKNHFDLWQMARDEFTHLGVADVYIAEIDTATSKHFHSYRGNNKTLLRNTTYASL